MVFPHILFSCLLPPGSDPCFCRNLGEIRGVSELKLCCEWYQRERIDAPVLHQAFKPGMMTDRVYRGAPARGRECLVQRPFEIIVRIYRSEEKIDVTGENNFLSSSSLLAKIML